MTDIQPFQNTPYVPEPSDDALNAIMRQAEAMSAAHKLGSALASTDMVPKDYKGKPDNATAAILYGAEVGLTAIQALQQIFIVHGKPAMYGRTMVALVMRAGHEIGEVEASADSVTWHGRRRDNGREFSAEWSMERAKLAGYTSNAKYQTNPIEMLRAKAQTEVCRTLFPDVLMGMSHSVEDLELETIRVVSERVDPPKRGIAGLKAALAPAPAPEPEPTPEQPVVEYATRDQQVRIAELLDGQGVKTKAAKLEYLQKQFGDTIKSAADVTATDAAALITFLEQPADGDTA